MLYEEGQEQPSNQGDGNIDLPTGQSDQLLRAAEVAQLLGVRTKRVYELGIPEVRLSVRTVRWRLGTVLEWICSHARGAA